MEKETKYKADIAALRKKYPNARTTESGLMYVVMKEGSGPSPQMGMPVTVHYTGSLLDGTVFDSSVKRNQPATFNIGQVIQGWNEALMMMKKGSKWLLLIPPELGYGERGAGNAIPPNAFLIFEVEILDF